jgi:hypothetical protein
MAVKWLPLVHEGTSTSGTGALTLDGTPPTDRRSFVTAQGNAEIAASGDEVYFIVSDLGANPPGTNWELNRGVWTAAGNTLTRTNPPIASSNGGALVNFPSGGKRDVYTVVDPILFALLASAQTFTAAQTISASGTALSLTGASNPEILIDEGGSGTSYLRLQDTSNLLADISKTAAAGSAILNLSVNPSDGAGAATVRLFRATNTTGNKNFDVHAGDGSATVAQRLSNSGCTLTGTVTVNGTAVALQGVLSAPSGGKLLWGSTTLPTGWSVIASTSDRTILTTETAAEGGSTGGSWTVSGITAAGTSITISQMPDHDHTVFHGVAVAAAGSDFATGRVLPVTGGDDQLTAVTGSGNTHTHTLSSDGTWKGKWIKALWIVKA